MLPSRALTLAKAAFVAALVIHALFLLSLPTGFLNPLFVEASQGHGQASDFYGIYQAGANLLHGYSIYDSADYRHEAPQVVPFYYFYRYLPPTAYGAALIALVLPPQPAYWAWVIVNEALIALVVLSILRLRRWPADRRWLAAALWAGFFPLYIEQVMGQFSLLMAVLLWILWRADALAAEPAGGARAPGAPGREVNASQPRSPAFARQSRFGPWRGYRWHVDSARPWSATAAWAASIALKTFSAFLAFPYLRDARLKRVVAGMGLVVAMSLPYFLAWPADLREFLRLNLSPFSPQIYKGSFGLQMFLRDLITHMPGGWTSPAFAIAGRSVSIAGLLLLGASALIVALALAATWLPAIRRRGPAQPAEALPTRPLRDALDLALWVTVFFLIFKSVWEYHYVMILPAVTALLLVTGSRAVLSLGVLLGLPTLFGCVRAWTGADPLGPLGDWPGWFRVLYFSAKSVPTLALFGWCLRAMWRCAGNASFARPGN